MGQFRENSIFVWNNHVIEDGDPARIIALLRQAGFAGAYLHSTHTTNWRTAARIALARALKAEGFAVYASVAVYARETPAGNEGQQAADIVTQYGLDGCVFDVESGEYETTGAEARVRALLLAYKTATDKPAAFCGWPFYHATNNPSRVYHPVGVLVEAMKIADYAMPMAYPGGDNNIPAAVAYLEAVWKQWRTYTNKPIVIAGRAANDNAGTANTASIVPYATRARELGTHGLSWWDMEHALKLPGMWAALAQANESDNNGGDTGEQPGEDNGMANAIGLFTKTATWTNEAFQFIHGWAGLGLTKNENIAPIQTKAEGAGLPFGLWYEFTTAPYSHVQIDMNSWPDAAHDEPLQKFILPLTNRTYSSVVIQVDGIEKFRNVYGEPENPLYISHAAQTFTGRVRKWLDDNGRASVRVIVASSNAFIEQYAAPMNNWVGQYPSCAVQKHALPLDKSLPVEGDKPAYLDNRPTCEFWRYFEYGNSDDAIILYRMGDIAALRTWLGYGTTPPPDDDDADTAEILRRIDIIAQEQVALHAALNERLAKIEADQLALTARLSALENKQAQDVQALRNSIPTGAQTILLHS